MPTANNSMRIWFHGTDLDAAKSISRNGFRTDTHFARALEDALEFGGPFVFHVALDCEPRIEGNWQMVVGRPVPVQSILRLIYYDLLTLEDHPRRARAAFPPENRRMTNGQQALPKMPRD